jgi:hypothetical protein
MPMTNEIVHDLFDRIHEEFGAVTDGLDPATLAFRPSTTANSVAWLLWHLARVQDDHVAGLAGHEQVWTANGWCELFGLPLDPTDTGYGHSSKQVASVQIPSVDLLRGYHEEVHSMSDAYISGLDDDALARVVDRSWDPPVTAAVRLVSVVADCLQHLGQAAYVRGLSPQRN